MRRQPPAPRGALRLDAARRGLAAGALLALVAASPACRRSEPVTAAVTTPPSASSQASSAGDAAGAVELPAGASASEDHALLRLPHATLVALSDWSAVLKPCGCTEELQRGGIERIAHWVRDQARRDAGLAVLHAGTLLVEDEAPAPTQRAQRALRQAVFLTELAKLPIAGVALSSVDLEQGGDAVRTLLKGAKVPLLADGWDHGVAGVVARRTHTLADGTVLGVFALDPAAGELDRQQALADAHVAALRAAGARFVVALSNLGLRNSRRLARRLTGVDALVIGALPERIEPVEEADREGAVWLLEAPRHGAYMAVLTLADHGAAAPGVAHDASAFIPSALGEIDARLTALRADLARLGTGAQSAATEQSLPFWRRQLGELERRRAAVVASQGAALPQGRLGAFRSVGLAWSAPVAGDVAASVATYEAAAAEISSRAAADPVPAAAGVASYLGASVCLGCHAKATDFAHSDRHGHAFATLEKANKTKDLDCVPCHTTGWQRPGGSAFANLGRFRNVQCEACHGPGSDHVAASDKSGGAGLIARPTDAVCLGCHTPEHAPRFEFGAYAPRLRVPGHGLPKP